MDEIRQALAELRDGLQRLLGDNLLEVRLFGSRARGDAEPDSDVDVMVFLKNKTPEIDDKILEIASDISIKHNLVIIPFVWDRAKVERNRELNTLLYRNIINEGIAV